MVSTRYQALAWADPEEEPPVLPPETSDKRDRASGHGFWGSDW